MSWSRVVHRKFLTVRSVYTVCSAGLRKNPFISKSIQEHSQRLKLLEQPENPRVLNVSIIGAPNSGKSTLMNTILGFSVSAASPKAHTTRKNVIGVYTEESAQIIFYDSPGLVTAAHCIRHRLEPNFRTDPQSSVNVSDMILAIVDCSNPRENHKLNPGIIDILHKFEHKPSILVLNKVDILNEKYKTLEITNRLTNGIVDGTPVLSESNVIDEKERKSASERKVLERMMAKGYIHDISLPLAEQVDSAIGWGQFSRVFMISALQGDGVKDLLEYLVSQAKEGDWQYNCDLPTPRNPLSVASDIIREQILIHLRRDAPYLINIVIQNWSHDPRTGSLAIYAELIAPNVAYTQALIGGKGSTISSISMAAREALCNTFQCDVMLKIAVKCKNSNDKKK